MAFGLVMMGSASMDYAFEQYGNPFFHIKRHATFLVAGMAVILIISGIPSKLWEMGGSLLLIVGLTLLMMVLIPQMGREVNGSMRWLAFGSITLQPSELMKFCFVIYMAGYLVRQQSSVTDSWSGAIKPLGVLSVLTVLLLLEPDFGSALVLVAAGLGMLFLAGVRLSRFLVLTSGALSVCVVLAFWSRLPIKAFDCIH